MAVSSATAGTAVAPSADAEVVQIDLIGNQVSTGSNNFNPDFTGDGVPDGPFTASASSSFTASGFQFFGVRISNTFYSSVPAYARIATPTGSIIDNHFAVRVGTNYTFTNAGPQGPISGLFQVTFSDANFNSGNPTGGWIEFRAFNSSGNPKNTVQAVRMVFDDASTTRPVGGVVSPGGMNTVIGSVASGGSFVPVATPAPPAVSPTDNVLRVSLKNKIKKLKKKIKKASSSTKKKRLKSKLKKLKKKLKALG